MRGLSEDFDGNSLYFSAVDGREVFPKLLSGGSVSLVCSGDAGHCDALNCSSSDEESEEGESHLSLSDKPTWDCSDTTAWAAACTAKVFECVLLASEADSAFHRLSSSIGTLGYGSDRPGSEGNHDDGLSRSSCCSRGIFRRL